MPHLTTILVYNIEQDPWFTSLAQPLVRWAREIWLATSDWHSKAGDVLSFTELDEAVDRIKKITGDDRLTSSKRERHRQGLLRAAAAALTQLGWNFKNHRDKRSQERGVRPLFYLSSDV